MAIPEIVPPPPDAPNPPAFGWVTDFRGLTRNEMNTIREILDVKTFGEADGQHFAALIAVAYARRVSVESYPWECAANIPFSDLAVPDLSDSTEAEAEHAEKVAEAALTGGEEPPDPA